MSGRKRPDRCADLGHPGCTYNRSLDRTWCLCGERTYEGDQAVPHVACCGGPLIDDPDWVQDGDR